MLLGIIPYILAIMIFYDFSLHFLDWIFGRDKCRKDFRPYWPIFKNRKKYVHFWTIYWGIAFILIIIYITTL